MTDKPPCWQTHQPFQPAKPVPVEIADIEQKADNIIPLPLVKG